MEQRPRDCGFTLVELMIVVAIIGIIAALAYSAFERYLYRAKSAEAPLNLRAIASLEATYAVANDRYMPAEASPAGTPGMKARPWVDAGDFANLGWTPEGNVYFQYQVNVGPQQRAFAGAARADLDKDGTFQIWGVAGELPGAPGPATCPFGGKLTQQNRVEALTPGEF